MKEVNSEQKMMEDVSYETFSDDIRTLRGQRNKAVGSGENAIALFQYDDNWFAFEKDADRIFEKMGWQTSAKLMDEGALSWMNIGYNGMSLLNASGMEVHVLQPKVGIEVVDWSSEEDYRADRFSMAQQTIDYLRQKNHADEDVVNAGQFLVHSNEDSIDTITSIDFIHFTTTDVDLFTSSGKTVNLVSGQHWNVADAEDFIITAGQVLDMQQAEVEHSLAKHDALTMQQQLRTADVLEEFNAAVSKYRYDHVLMEQGDFYESFSDDAVSMARKYNLNLWERDMGSGQTVPMVMLDMRQADRLLGVADDVLIEESSIKESRNELVLKPSPLNEGLHSELNFNESGIKKTRNGDYMVWARMSGVDLPDMTIPSDMGIRYSRLTSGAEKEITLRTVLQQTYGAGLSQMAQQSKSACVKL